MKDYLPMNNFAWVPVENLLAYAETHVLNTPDDSTYGFILEVDLDYPEELHILHNCLPLGPETRKITVDMFSPQYQIMMNKNGLPLKETLPKLVPSLDTKRNYVIHYRNLKYYISKGLKLVKVHKILTFDQGPWLSPYIDFNTEKRKEATNEFQRDFFKLMNNR